MSWCFAIINNRIGEIYFEKMKGGKTKFLGHCYVQKKDFRTLAERRALEHDIEKVRVVYRKGDYTVITK